MTNPNALNGSHLYIRTLAHETHGARHYKNNFILFFSSFTKVTITCHYEVLIWGSIECALATKFGGEVGAYEVSITQKEFGQILNRLGDIKIINIFNGVPKSKLRENKILMCFNMNLC